MRLKKYPMPDAGGDTRSFTDLQLLTITAGQRLGYC